MEKLIDDFVKAAVTGTPQQIEEAAKKLCPGEGFAKTFAKVNKHKGKNVLIGALSAGNIDLCKYLIEEAKVDVNLQDWDGYTPLHMAILQENLPMIHSLLGAGADDSLGEVKKMTPLHMACMTGNMEVLELLVSRGADVNSKSLSGTPIQVAIANGGDKAVKFLLRHNANPNQNSHNFGPIFMSITEKQIKCLVPLLQAGADPNIDGCGMMPLCMAASTGEVEIVSYLLEYGADPNAVAMDGITALEHAALNSDIRCMELLFPVTSPIEHFPDWSISGILEHIISDEANEQRNMKLKAGYHIYKSNGKAAILKEQYMSAGLWFTKALEAKPYDVTLYAARSMCLLRVHSNKQALVDAKMCVKMKPNWWKAHYTEGLALKSLKNYLEAAMSFARAAHLDPNNKAIRKEIQELAKLSYAS